MIYGQKKLMISGAATRFINRPLRQYGDLTIAISPGVRTIDRGREVTASRY